MDVLKFEYNDKSLVYHYTNSAKGEVWKTILTVYGVSASISKDIL